MTVYARTSSMGNRTLVTDGHISKTSFTICSLLTCPNLMYLPLSHPRPDLGTRQTRIFSLQRQDQFARYNLNRARKRF